MDKASKRYKFILIAVMALAIICMLVCSCAKNIDKETNQDQINDFRGETFSLNLPINKIVSTYSPIVNHSIVLGKGTTKYISGVGRKDIANGLYEKVLPNWNELHSVGSNTSPVNKEEIIKLNPNLIVLPQFNWQIREKDFEGTNIRTFVCFSDNESFEAVVGSIKTLAKLFHEEDRANQVVEKYENIINDVKNELATVKNLPKIAFVGPEKYSLVGSNMLQNQIIETAGGQSISKDENWNTTFEKIDAETLVNKNPEYIFLPSYANFSVSDIINDEKLASIDAVKNKHVYKFPSSLDPWDWPTCSSALGSAWLANKLHPNEYYFDKLAKNTLEFYELLYNRPFNLEEIGIQ